MLQLQNISKTYNGKRGAVHAVDGLSLSVANHEAVAIRGPSGCGKSTLLLMAGSLLRPTSGLVLVDGTNPYSLSANERAAFRANSVGFVFQQFHLIPYLNVLQNILTANIPLKLTKAMHRAEELIERFDLKQRVEHLPGELSVGEKQRIALARAVFHRPRLLLADEPTGNLDPENANVVLKAMRQYASEGAAVVMVTHAPDAALQAHRILEMSHGQLVEKAA